jgi:hypothetical protein
MKYTLVKRGRIIIANYYHKAASPAGQTLQERNDPRRPREEVVDQREEEGKARNSDARMRVRESDSTLQ